MAKRLGYADALKVLGRDDSVVLDFAEKLAEGGVKAFGVPGLSSVAGLVVRSGRQALTGIREKITGINRMDRTERVTAAYNILMVLSVFEALDEVLQESRARLSLDDLDVKPDEQMALIEQSLGHELMTGEWKLAASRGRTELMSASGKLGTLAEELARFLAGLAVWEELDETTRAAGRESIRQRLPDLTERRFQESYRLLAADVPEFGVWANMAAHEDTHRRADDIDTGLSGLRELIEGMDSRRALDRRRSELSALYRAALNRRVLRSSDAPAGLTLPTLESAYLAPRGRFAVASLSGMPSSEAWWGQVPLHNDLQSLVAGMLTRQEATESPIVILGHPGAGKSVLTEMLAARLSTADFFALRVELRAVPPNAPIHSQIEEGVAATLNTAVQWRTLAESANGALPVIILDGFDELLQASGVNRSDYLEQVQEFQRQQEALGQPVAVIVTSRTVVADRARFPEGAPILRLEPFDDLQIAGMVEIWNAANEAAYTARGLQAPALGTLLPYRELARQPLLLLMLLVYDAEDNALQRSGGELSRSQLYEHLLTMFAEREVRKHRSNLGDAELARAIEDELHRLEVVAIAMFTRQRQSVAADELDHDLAVLMPDAALRPADADLHGAVSDAHQVLGRFFFVHESQAQVESRTASVFEFLHATFGEYLVARAVTAELAELLAARQFAARRPRAAPPMDDGLFYALTSFALLAGSAATVEFTQDLFDLRLAERPEERAEYRELLIDLFREAPYPPAVRSYTDYQPRRLPIAERQAAHTANLVILLTRVAPEGVDISELFSGDEPFMELHYWRGLAGQWRALPNPQWHGLLDTIRLRHLGYLGESPRSVLFPLDTQETQLNVGECIGFDLYSDTRDPLSLTDPYSVTLPNNILTAGLLRSASVRINGTAARLVMVLLPYLANVSEEPLAWLEDVEEKTSWAEAHDVLELRLALPSADRGAQQERLRRYERLLSSGLLGRVEAVVLRQAAEDLALTEYSELSEYANNLARALAAYLRDVDEVTPAAVESASLPRVLDRLHSDMMRLAGVFNPEHDRVLGLIDAARTDSSGPPDGAPSSTRQRRSHRRSPHRESAEDAKRGPSYEDFPASYGNSGRWGSA